jgi:hypothetical protein
MNEIESLKLTDKQLEKLAKIATREGITLSDAIGIYGEGMLTVKQSKRYGELLSGEIIKIYKYRSPYRPIPMNYIPKEIKFNYDNSTIGQWSPNTIYAFESPLPQNLIEQWDLTDA